MKILVLTKNSIPTINRTIPVWASPDQSVSFHLNTIDDHPHAIISMGVGVMEPTWRAIDLYPAVPLFCYNWDCYEWVWTNPRPGEYDYHEYGRLLSRAKEVWVPSRCTGLRANQWWGLSNWHTILSSVPWWDAPVKDDGYLLCTLRRIPDPWCDEFDTACESLGIPFVRTDRASDPVYRDYKEVVANCRGIVNHYYEASTGGLTLLEAYRLGKPVLCSDSTWNGSGEYFGDRALYFRHGDRSSFQKALVALYKNPPSPSADCREWVETNFSDRRMVQQILERIHANS
jgi:hypothetical protein